MSHKAKDCWGDDRYGEKWQIQQQKKGDGAEKTSVGLHSRGVIPAISVGNTSALPAGSPSGGVRVGAAAAAAETDVQLGERRRMFFTFGSASLPSAWRM